MYPYEKYLQIYQKYQRSEKAFEDELEIWNFCQKHQELDGYHGYLEFIKLKTNSVAYQKLTLNKIDGAIIILLLIVSLY